MVSLQAVKTQTYHVDWLHHSSTQLPDTTEPSTPCSNTKKHSHGVAIQKKISFLGFSKRWKNAFPRQKRSNKKKDLVSVDWFLLQLIGLVCTVTHKSGVHVSSKVLCGDVLFQSGPAYWHDWLLHILLRWLTGSSQHRERGVFGISLRLTLFIFTCLTTEVTTVHFQFWEGDLEKGKLSGWCQTSERKVCEIKAMVLSRI